MNNKLSPRHSVHRIFVVMIFGLFLLFLLLMLLFGARAYSVSVAGSQKNNNLYTAIAYVTAKFRQHDTGTDQKIYCDTLGNSQALCMTDIIEGTKYITYIYLQDNNLKELFTAADTSPSPEMGTIIASLNDFRIQEISDHFYQITFQDCQGEQSSLVLHSGTP